MKKNIIFRLNNMRLPAQCQILVNFTAGSSTGRDTCIHVRSAHNNIHGLEMNLGRIESPTKED